jgi:hypothetical protein
MPQAIVSIGRMNNLIARIGTSTGTGISTDTGTGTEFRSSRIKRG